MCWQCDDPTRTADDYYREVVLPDVERYGWHLQLVEGSRQRAPFAYTVGLTGLGLPELLVTGLVPVRAAELLDGMAAHWAHAQPPPEPGERLTTREARRLEVVALPQPQEHLLVARALYGRVRGRQLVWCDDRGHWPWQPGHRAGRGGQPVLGPRAATAPRVRGA